jgi:cell division protein FtsB
MPFVLPLATGAKYEYPVAVTGPAVWVECETPLEPGGRWAGFNHERLRTWTMDKFSWDAATLRRNAVYVLVLVCVALLVHEIFGTHGFLALRREKKEVESLRQQIRQLQQENGQLDKQIKALKSDPKAIERLAREQIRLARPGEIIYTLPEKDPKKSQAPPAAQESKPK